jgi:hypothetical protein
MASYELNDEQINELFSFCKKHYVHHYDVQVELVDHLANAIEEKINANPNLSFEKALDEVYKTFGYKGFAGIVEAKTIAIEKQYRKLRYKLFFAYFTWPKAIFTLMLFLSLLSLKIWVPANFQYELIGILSIAFIISESLFDTKVKRLFKKQNQRLLLTEVGVDKFFLSSIGIFLINLIYRFLEKQGQISWMYFGLFSLFIVVMVLFSLAYVELCKQLHAKARKEYPIAFA